MTVPAGIMVPAALVGAVASPAVGAVVPAVVGAVSVLLAAEAEVSRVYCPLLLTHSRFSKPEVA